MVRSRRFPSSPVLAPGARVAFAALAALVALAALAGCRGEGPGDLQFENFEPTPTIQEPTPDAKPPRLVINEVMTRNDSTIGAPADGNDPFPDWVELYNAGPEPVDLALVTLRDRGGNVWLGMPGSVAPGERVLLWADASIAPYHLPFRLAGEGDELTLAIDEVVVDRLATGAMDPDTAWARFPDGGQWSLTIRGTPGWTNGNAGSDTIDPTDVLFQRERVSEFHITLPQASWSSLEVSPYTQVPGDVAFASAFYGNIGVRIKGRYGSLRSIYAKAAFKVDLNDYRPGQAIRGLNNLTFNNMVQDPSYIHEYLTYSFFRAAGLPAPRVGWTRLYINDEYFGLYLFMESIDDRFLARWYNDPSGHLFEGAYGVDFEVGEIWDFEYDEGPNPDDRTDLEEIAILLQGPATDANIAALGTMFDMDQFVTYMAIEALTLHWDGYTTSNNYRVYHDPETDLFQIIPWGTDQTLENYWYYPYQGNGRIFQFCMQNPGCRARYSQALRDMADLMESLDLVSLSYELEALLMDDIIADPRREVSLQVVQNWFADTRYTLATWPDQVRGLIEP